MSHSEICVQYDAINAVIAAAQEILIKSAQPVAHEGHGTYSGVLTSSCPEGAPFSQQQSAKKRRPLSHPQREFCRRRGHDQRDKEEPTQSKHVIEGDNTLTPKLNAT